jgi:hypothetical protein
VREDLEAELQQYAAFCRSEALPPACPPCPPGLNAEEWEHRIHLGWALLLRCHGMLVPGAYPPAMADTDCDRLDAYTDVLDALEFTAEGESNLEQFSIEQLQAYGAALEALIAVGYATDPRDGGPMTVPHPRIRCEEVTT